VISTSEINSKFVQVTVLLLLLLLLCVTVNQGPILSSTIIPPSSSVDDLDVPGWVKSSAKMLNGGIEGQDWVALAKKLGKSLTTVVHINLAVYFKFNYQILTDLNTFALFNQE